MPDHRAALPRWLAGAILIVAAPGIACFGYYSLADAGAVGAGVGTLVVLAYPAALLGLCGLVAAGLSPRRTPVRVWAAALCFAVPAAFLLLIRG